MAKPEDIKSQLSDAIKKVVLTGVGTLFLTEEAVRNTLGDLKLPKELLTGLLENANKQKQEFLGLLVKEMVGVLSKIDVPSELKKFVDGRKLRVNVEFSFEPVKVSSKSSTEKKTSDDES